MSMYRQKIALDLDGVIWDLVKPWVAEYNKKYNDNIQVEDIGEYILSNTLKKATPEELSAILLEPNFWDKVLPFSNSYEYLEKLNTEFEVYIATKTDYKLYEIKVERLLQLFPFLKQDQIICTYNKRILDVDWLVDDYEDNLLGGKFNKIILDASYNRNIPYLNWYRAKDLKDVYNIIKYGDK